MKKQFRTTAVHRGMVHMLLLTAGGVAAAQTQATDDKKPDNLETVVVTGQRAALQTAQKIKQNADEIVDSVVAEEAGKLPDKSITEVLQRVVGVTMNRNRSRGDPEHFSVEGSGIAVRGLTWGSSNLNGREMFSAGWPGRELSWDDVPPELMAGVDVYKNPSADRLEGGVSGQVDLRTWLPFDFKTTKTFVTLKANYAELGRKWSPGASGLYTTQWDTDSGKWGVLVDLAYNRSTFLNQSLQVGAFFPHTDVAGREGMTSLVPESSSWRTNTGDTKRLGVYAALQWKKNDMQSALTYFAAGSKQNDTEAAFFSSNEDPYKNVVTNGVFDSRGVFQSGTLSMPIGGLGANKYPEGGLKFSTNRAFSDRTSRTGELAWNFKWKINDRWAVQNDMQWVHSTYDSLSANVYLNTFVPSMNVDLSGGGPVRITFDDLATSRLADPGNYYWDSSFAMQSKAKADLYAWKADASYKFEDNPVLRELRFGVRLSSRSSTTQNAGGNGYNAIAYPWEVRKTSVAGQLPSATDPESWQSRASLGYLSDPRYGNLAPVDVNTFGNFYSGLIPGLPNVVFPSLAIARDYPNGYKTLSETVAYQQCVDSSQLPWGTSKAACDATGPNTWKSNHTFTPLGYDDDPKNIGRHSEDTQAIYGSLRFGFEDLPLPVEGSVGLRVVRSKAVAHGYEIFKPDYNAQTPPDLPRFDAFARPIDKDHSYTKGLPSLNVKVNFTDQLQARVALAKSIYRPGFGDLREYVTLSQTYDQNNKTATYKGENQGNAKLKPITANNADLSLEWYPQSGQSITGAVFYKDVKDIIMKSVYTRTYNSVGGNPQTFAITGPDNVASGKIKGVELAGQTYLDKIPGLKDVLPEWAKGFGVQANYTYIDGKQKLYRDFALQYCPAGNAVTNASLFIYGCDTNGMPFTNLPLPELSRGAFNLGLMYDKGSLSARLAYNWRSRYLQAVNANSTQGTNATSADPARAGARDVGWGLPVWMEAGGQWDAGLNYAFSDGLKLSFNVTNLTAVVKRQTQQQTAGPMPRQWFNPGRSYDMNVRYEF
ncbi:TonB-dependent receptor [Roseateles sp.]|uniref:TonB-dependent receptor n=1 Tax=Roseateles sp. TaxID=1971397 RepID=UPI002E182066